MNHNKNKIINKNRLRIVRIASIPGVLLIWILLTYTGLVKPLYLPSPIDVLKSLNDIGITTFLKHFVATLFRVLIGFLLGSLFGILFGLLMRFSRYVDAAFYKIIEAWRPVPPVALIPFFILWFGFSELGKILLVALGCFLIMIVNTYEAVQNVKPIYKRAAYSLGANEIGVYTTIIMHAIIPELTAGLRIALALSISLVIVSEFMGADYGLGYLINISKVTFSTHTILLGIIFIGGMSGGLDYLLRKIMNYLSRWMEKSTEAIT